MDTQQQGAQALGQTGLGLLGQINQNYSQGFNPVQPGQAQQQAQNAAYAENAQYLDPQFSQGQAQMTQQLANQGLTPGTEAYNNAQGNFDRAKQAAYSDARNQAILQGNQAENQYYNQALTNYQLPLNSYSALMSNTQYQNPTFQNIPGVNQATTNVAGITQNSYQDALQQYNAQTQAQNNLISGVGNLGLLGYALYSLSDRRAKHDIRRVGETSKGIPLYQFRYNLAPASIYIGVMADEVTHIPGAVHVGPDGYARVDYARIEP